MSKIDDRAIVGKKANIGEGVEVGPFTIIEDDVTIGAGCRIAPHAFICSGTTLGENVEVHMGAVIGNVPQDLGFDRNKKTYTRIGNGTVIREYATIHRSTVEGGATTVGEGSYLMAMSHVGHDCAIGNHVILANGALLAGHVSVGDYTFVSGNVVVHQFCRIGTVAMIGGFTGINKDVPPYMLVRGPSVVRGVNLVGLRRLKFSREIIGGIREAYKLIFMSNLNTAQAIEGIRKLKPAKELDHLVEFIQDSKRGICKYKYSDDEYFE
ncbi:MAG: acyl-ACP--UDP-N-acetylglucosamine O-acyltransferase [Candidatus Omnitrophica bacterium]|nr:acyl-ACP--UDP-N-acetylglucosamine O-acyltransferase [Candidatus Omnitrophota bacterium]